MIYRRTNSLQQKLVDQTVDKWLVATATPYCHRPRPQYFTAGFQPISR